MSKVLLTACAFGLTSVAALFLATGTAHAAGVDYICGHYSIVVEPKNRTYQSFDGNTQTTSTVTVTKSRSKKLLSLMNRL